MTAPDRSASTLPKPERLTTDEALRGIEGALSSDCRCTRSKRAGALAAVLCYTTISLNGALRLGLDDIPHLLLGDAGWKVMRQWLKLRRNRGCAWVEGSPLFPHLDGGSWERREASNAIWRQYQKVALSGSCAVLSRTWIEADRCSAPADIVAQAHAQSLLPSACESSEREAH